MLVVMVVSLYTSRVILSALGVEDFGIFNAVGGIVAMMGFLNNSMANAVQRFLSFEIGRRSKERVNIIFNVSFQAHIIIAFVVFVVMEIAGVGFLNNQMNIPTERMYAANWVLQFSIISTMFNVLQVPFNALILAKERMNIYAYVSILEVVFRLAIVYLLLLTEHDRLITYGILTMMTSVIIILIYVAYCRRSFVECRFRFVRDSKSMKELTSFASWNMLGEIAWVLTGQGVNIILNIFFGPVVNAARGVSHQIEGAVMRFVSSFQSAINPQVIKTYAANQHQQTINLVYTGTRFSYFLLLILSLPLFFEIEYILELWLEEVPGHTSTFCKLSLVSSLVMILSNLFATVAKAYGKIRNYQIVISFLLMLNFPLSYLMLHFGLDAASVVWVSILINALCLIARLCLMKKMIVYSLKEFCGIVLTPLLVVSALSVIAPIVVCNYLEPGFIRLCLNTFISEFVLLVIIYTIGLRSKEKEMISGYIKKMVKR